MLLYFHGNMLQKEGKVGNDKHFSEIKEKWEPINLTSLNGFMSVDCRGSWMSDIEEDLLLDLVSAKLDPHKSNIME